MVTAIGAGVASNDVLQQIVPANNRLLIEVLVPNEEKGYLETGQSVDIKLDAFLFQKYGRLSGRLEWISVDAELSTDGNISLLAEAAPMRALRTSISQLRLPLGLTAKVDIHTDRHRIIDFFFLPIERANEEAIGVR